MVLSAYANARVMMAPDREDEQGTGGTTPACDPFVRQRARNAARLDARWPGDQTGAKEAAGAVFPAGREDVVRVRGCNGAPI